MRSRDYAGGRGVEGWLDLTIRRDYAPCDFLEYDGDKADSRFILLL